MPDPGEQVRSALLRTIEMAADVAKATRVAVKDVAVGALKDAGEIAANTAIFAGTVKSAIIGVADAGRGAMEGVRGAAGGIIQAAAELGLDLAQASASALRGVLEAAGELGQDGGKLARAAAEGMIEAAGSLGETAVASVRRGLVEAAAIPRDVIDAAVRRAEEREGDGEESPTGNGR